MVELDEDCLVKVLDKIEIPDSKMLSFSGMTACVNKLFSFYTRQKLDKWYSTFRFKGLPEHLQQRLGQQVIIKEPCFCMLRCVNNQYFNKVHLFDYWTTAWYRRSDEYNAELEFMNRPSPPGSVASSVHSESSHESWRWELIGDSSGTDDENE